MATTTIISVGKEMLREIFSQKYKAPYFTCNSPTTLLQRV